jgi:hypothetical protein
MNPISNQMIMVSMCSILATFEVEFVQQQTVVNVVARCQQAACHHDAEQGHRCCKVFERQLLRREMRSSSQ